MKYIWRFSCEEERLYMKLLLVDYLKYLNKKSNTNWSLYRIDGVLSMRHPEFINMDEFQYKYTVSIYIEGEEGGYSLWISKKRLKEWMDNNNIVKPKFKRAKIIRKKA